MTKSLLEELFAKHADEVMPGYVRQYRFHPTRRWLLDFAWPEFKIAVEIDGGTFSGGRHVRGVGFEKDCVKLNEAALLGWCVLRFTGAMVKDGRARATMERLAP